uniref:ATPase inhibitor, mitochondrial n=1 Tax=Denticeps clupeoides TaxID=299321 RepID=A0AAY4C553_9TELE
MNNILGKGKVNFVRGLGKGAGKGGGGGGTVREAGGGLGKRGAVQEESYFRKKTQENLKDLKEKKLKTYPAYPPEIRKKRMEEVKNKIIYYYDEIM